MKNKKMKKIISVLLSLVILMTTLCIAPFVSQAVSNAEALDSTGISFWADPENKLTQSNITAFQGGDKTSMVGAVGVFKRSSGSSNYYLFLPSTADCTKLKVWFTASTATVNGTEVKNGEPTNVFADINEGGVSQVYTIVLDSTSYTVRVMKSGDVATIYIDTASGSISNINKNQDNSESGSIMVVQPDGRVDYNGYLEKMTGRGNGTWDHETKKPYNIKLGTSTSLLGMNKAKKWCLLANYEDATLIKNQITYDFAKYIGIKYQPIVKPVDLYVNQQYFGAYNLSEKVEIKSNRLDITDSYENLEIANGTVDPATGLVVPKDLTGTKVVTKSGDLGATTTGTAAANDVGARRYSEGIVSPTDITGGYLYELEISRRWVEEGAGFCAYNRQGWVIKNCDYATKDMVNYSYNLLYALGSSVYNNGTVPSKKTTTSTINNGTLAIGIKTTSNPAPDAKYQGKRWSDILDADSAVRYYWTQEYFKNMDSSTSSTYFYKDSDSIDTKLYAGPMWDMDNSIGFDRSGSRWGASWTDSTGWYTKVARIYRFLESDGKTSYSTDKEVPLNFYAALATNCSDFWQMASSYWYTLIEPATKILLGEATDPTGVLHSTEYYANTVQKSGTMDNWRHHLNNDEPYDAAAVTSGMNTWFTERDNWIDSQISKVDINSASVAPVDAQVCTGSPVEPALTITYNGTTLQKDVDYTAEYSNNIAATKNAQITIKGIGLYTGTKTVTFQIQAGTLSGGSVTIPEMTYANEPLTAVVKNADGVELDQYISYQWKADGVDIAGETAKTYTVKPEDVGKSITVSVSGDGTNFATLAITSNACLVAEGERPKGYSKTIASWDYDYTTAPEALVTADAAGTSYYYKATSGENADSSELRASVNAKDYAQIKWSGTADLYVNADTSLGTDQSPVMGTSKSAGLAWGQYPYFETTVSTLGYEDIHFTSKLGGTKKAPRDWKLQYSLDGVNYTDVENASHRITANKTMEQAFNDVKLPAECDNQSKVYVRMVVYADAAINGINAIINQTSGDAAVNNVRITGSSTAVVTRLEAPSFSTTSTLEDATNIFDSQNVVITDNNGGADVYYSVNGGEAKLYQGAFNPFDSKTAVKGDSVEIKAWAAFEDIKSEITAYTVTFAGVNISSYDFIDYSQNVSNGAVFSNGGIYGESGKMSAYTDGSGQYVPLWDTGDGAYKVAPDDGMKWSSQSGFYFETTTIGYDNVSFTAKTRTSKSGPNSVSLQYSLDKESWKDVQSNVQLELAFAQTFVTTNLPDECSNQRNLYIRVITAEDKTHGDALVAQSALHNTESKGNMYINNVVISGNDNGSIKMPYTNKTTDYFSTGAIKYTSPDNTPMQCVVTDKESNVLYSGTYPAAGLILSTMQGFNPLSAGPYTVSVWAGDDDDRSIANTRKYYYKGETVVKFNYNDSTRPIANYISTDFTAVRNTSGANSGTLSMCPNASDPTVLTYTGTYGVKVEYSMNNPYAATKKLDNPNGNGFWLVETSTLGYSDLTLNLEQLSSNKGPRDWGLAYSLDGVNYTYLENSNARAISNDSVGSTVETYNNFALPEECSNQEKLFLKVFINGGESVDGTELETVLRGNTGINGIELSGVRLPKSYSVTLNTVALENVKDTTGTQSVDAKITVDGKEYTTTDGQLVVDLTEGKTYRAVLSVNGSFERTVEITPSEGLSLTTALVCVDMNGDGIINGIDYAMIRKNLTGDKKESYSKIFSNFADCSQENFSYTK